MAERPIQNATGDIMDRWLTVKEAAEITAFSPNTIYNRIAPGSENPFPVRVRRVGRSVRFSLRDLQEYMSSL